MRISLDCVLQYNTGSYGSPTWVAISNVGDVTINLEKMKADVSGRHTGKWKMEKGTFKGLNYEFDIKAKAGDTAYTAIKNAWLNDTQLDIAATDLPIASSGAQGPRAYMEVESISRKEALNDGVVYSVKLFLGYNTQAPVWVETA